MRKFAAVFTNPKGLTLTLYFRYPNWNGITCAAQQALARHPEHAKHGPWTVGAIDLSA